MDTRRPPHPLEGQIVVAAWKPGTLSQGRLRVLIVAPGWLLVEPLDPSEGVHPRPHWVPTEAVSVLIPSPVEEGT